MIYLDNSATTKPYPEVLEAFVKSSQRYFGNPSSVHGLGTEAERLLNQARNATARLLNIKESEVIFTSGGTEGNNLAIKGIAYQYQRRGKHLVTTTIEHASTHEAFKQLEEQGFDVTYLPVNEKGLLSIEDLKDAIREDTILVSIIHVNNELGTIQPIEEIGKLLKSYPKLLFHVDHVQGIGKVPLKFKQSNVDLCTISGHKIHGLKGTGVLFVKDGVLLSPLFSGGEQEGKYRAGTENTAGIVSFAKALRMTLDRLSEDIPKLNALKQTVILTLETIEGIKINTPEESAPHIINFSVINIKPEVFIHALEEEGIYVSTKSACSSKMSQASRVIMETNLGTERAKSAIRVSMSFDTTRDEIESFLSVVKATLPKLQHVMR